uniref:Major facilitator superfamily (MFS) profile domain-containing protein n=1 Tax=Acrobeloides nanus TaxID=290746 RepID=A0A914E4X7_9BILA
MPPMGSAMPSSNIQKPAHKPKLGFFIYILASMAVIGSYLFGYGTGIVSDAMIYVARNKGMNPLDDLWHEIIVSCTMGAAGIGALIGGPLSDKFGRKKSIVISSINFTIGSIICAVAFNKYILLIGRLFVGFAIGISSMVVPVYVSEASPASIRGTLGVAFQLFLVFGLLSANELVGLLVESGE